MWNDTAASIDHSPFVELFNDFLDSKRVLFAAAVLVFFEHLITMDHEIELFWKRKFSGAATLFLANRYTVLVYVALQSAPISNSVTWTDHTCKGMRWMIAITEYATFIPPAAFSGMRVLALTSSKPFAAATLVLSLGPLCVNITQIALGFMLLASRGTLILADTFVIVLTWWKLFRHISSENAVPLHRRITLTDIFLRDGTIYFISLLVLNVLHLVFSLTLVFNANGGSDPQSDITVFTAPLTAILVSRFLSNLQEANLRSFRVDSDNPLYISSVSDTSRLSFVAAPRAAGSVGGSSVMDAHDATGAAEDGDIRCVERASYGSTEEELLDMEAATH